MSSQPTSDSRRPDPPAPVPERIRRLAGPVLDSRPVRWLNRPRPPLLAVAPLWAVVALLPLVAVLLSLRWIPGASLRRFVPGGDPYGWFNDEIDYWQQAASFVAAGFGAGQYGWDETAASFEASPYGTHGPVHPMLLGIVGKLVGFSTATPVLLGVAAVTGSLVLVACWWRSLEPMRAVLLAIALATAWPSLLMLPTGMQEPLHVAAAIVLGAGFAVMVRDARPSWGVIAPVGVVLLIATLLRATWGPLWIPYLLLAVRGRRPSVPPLALVAAGALVAVVGFGLSSWWSAPYPYGFLTQLRLVDGLGTRVDMVWDNTVANTGAMFGGADVYGARPFPLERLFYIQLIGVGLAGFLAAAVALRRRQWPGGAWTVHAWNLLPVLAVTLVLYDTLAMRGVRVLSAHLLLTLVLLAGTARVAGRLVVVAVAIAAVIGFGSYRDMFKTLHANHFPGSSPEVTSTQAGFSQAGVEYRSGADRWCNTVLWIADINRTALAVPRGVALHFGSSPGPIEGQPRSRWIVLRDDPEGTTAARIWRLRRRATLPGVGTLYENPGARCG